MILEHTHNRKNLYTTILFGLVIILTACVPELPLSTEKKTTPTPEIANTNIVRYTINTNNTITLAQKYKVTLAKDIAYQKDIATHNAIWALVKTIIPVSYLSYLKELILFNGEITRWGGYVTPADTVLKQWKLGLSLHAMDKTKTFKLLETAFNPHSYKVQTSHLVVIHEFAHILSLNNTQIDRSVTLQSCTTVYVFSGCAKKDSYIYVFYKDFWQGKEWDGKDSKTIYHKNPTSFTREYAATNVYEDFAESFSYYVLVKDIPLQSSLVYDKKALFFDKYTETKNMKTTIRNKLQLTKDSIEINKSKAKSATTLNMKL